MIELADDHIVRPDSQVSTEVCLFLKGKVLRRSEKPYLKHHKGCIKNGLANSEDSIVLCDYFVGPHVVGVNDEHYDYN